MHCWPSTAYASPRTPTPAPAHTLGAASATSTLRRHPSTPPPPLRAPHRGLRTRCAKPPLTACPLLPGPYPAPAPRPPMPSPGPPSASTRCCCASCVPPTLACSCPKTPTGPPPKYGPQAMLHHPKPPRFENTTAHDDLSAHHKGPTLDAPQQHPTAAHPGPAAHREQHGLSRGSGDTRGRGN